MSEDKRILRTKRMLRSTLIKLLETQTFEKITVKELCRVAKISRLTFYANYHDKYDLINDIFCDSKEQVLAKAHELNVKTNVSDDVVLKCKNLLIAVVDFFYDNSGFIEAVNYVDNPYVRFAFRTFLEQATEELIVAKIDPSHLKYPVKLTVPFVCSGIASFLGRAFRSGMTREETQSACATLINDLLSENVLLN